MHSRLDRRTFTKLGVLTGASALVLPACGDEAPSSAAPVELDGSERALLARFSEAYLQTDGTSLKPLASVPVLDNIEHAFSLMAPPILEQVRMGLKLFDYGAIFIGLHFRRFSKLSIEHRLDYIRRWEDGAEIQRGISTMLKKLVCYGYWKDIEAGRAIGYPGPVSVAGGIPSLGNAPMPETRG
jgi:hypothetical protein